MTQQELANLLAVPVNTLRMWDSGLRHPPTHIIARAREALAAQARRCELLPLVVLAALGLYALLTHSVAMRTREIGIRMAVGAAPRAISASIARYMLGLVLGGVVVGVPAALMGSAVLRSLLFGVSTTDRVTLAVTVVIVVAVGAAASAVPVVRASRVDPVRLLRSE